MVNLSEGIDSMYPADLKCPMAETLQLVHATDGRRRLRENDSRAEDPQVSHENLGVHTSQNLDPIFYEPQSELR